ncbi:MAG: hypothetical protein HC836_30495 [Richelia sp. RM2_1_2]|nr:hypothetical protein [Richelia sp. RM2_1_2]
MKLINLAELRELRLFEALAKVSAVAAVAGSTLLGSSLGVASVYLSLRKDVPVVVKKAVILGFGTTVGGTVFAIGAAMEDERRRELRIIAMQEKLLPVTCRQCKYFNYDYILRCAVNPSIAGTKAALDCKDFEANK